MNLILRLAAAASLALAAPLAAASPALLSYPDLFVDGAGNRGPIRVRLTAPAAGRQLPVLLFSHGAGYSGDDYLKLADYWAAHGFVVVQPTHLDARILHTAADDPRQPRAWHLRRDDMVAVLDALPAIAARTPALAGRIDAARIVVAGHSYGGFTAELLLGATTADPQTGARDDLSDPRILGGILLSAPGGFDGLTEEWTQRGNFLKVDWSTMTKPALIMIGQTDASPMSTRGADWHVDPFDRSPAGRVCLVAFTNAGHFLGGIGHDGPPAAHDPDDAQVVAMIQQATLAWARALVDGKPRGWEPERARLATAKGVQRVDCR